MQGIARQMSIKWPSRIAGSQYIRRCWTSYGVYAERSIALGGHGAVWAPVMCHTDGKGDGGDGGDGGGDGGDGGGDGK